MIPPESWDPPRPPLDFDACARAFAVAGERLTLSEQRLCLYVLAMLAATEGLPAMDSIASPASGLSESAETLVEEMIDRGWRDVTRMIRNYEVLLAEKSK